MSESVAQVVQWLKLPAIRRGPLVVLWTLLLLALALRVAAMFHVVLIPEEAYYWMYSEHPNLSYYDHPPMVAWVIGLGTWLFGDTEFGVRVVGSLLMLGASALMFVFGRMWFGRTTGLLAALLLQVLPVYFGMGFIATMDSALLFFWLLGMVGGSMALKRGRTWGWYLWGVGLGAGMLSKYTAVFLGAGIVLAVVGCRTWRWHLRSPHPYLAAMLALLMFSPVIIWNAQHDWASFRFQFMDRFGKQSFSFHNVGQYLAFQFAVATPLLLAVLAWLIVRVARAPRRVLRPRMLITVCLSIPMLLVMSYKALRYEVHINWTAPLYLSLFPLVAHLFLVEYRRFQRGMRGFPWRPVFLWTAIFCSALNALGMSYLLTFQPRFGKPNAFGPWRELAIVVEDYENRLERESGRNPLIVGDGKYRLASVLAFYRTPLEREVRASDFTTSQWILEGKGLGFAYWTEREKWIGTDCIYVDDDQQGDRITGKFASVAIVTDPRLNELKPFRVLIGRSLQAQPSP